MECSFLILTTQRRRGRPSVAPDIPPPGRARSTFRSGVRTRLACSATWAMLTRTSSIALQVETASCIQNIEEIAAVPGVDILFLGQNDLCMSMGLYETYEFPHMYTSKELSEATQTLAKEAKKNQVILGVFLFGTSRVGEFLEKGFTFISIGNDLHHVLTQSTAYVVDLESIAKNKNKNWVRRPTSLM